MCHEAFQQETIDIHTGGIDLRFPHHDNEIAQSEAFYSHDNWVNNFWHCGHLHIDGLKMSKSLKNFISIKNVLKTNNARAVRMMCLMHTWSSTMTFKTDDSLAVATSRERHFTNFFRAVQATSRNSTIKANVQKFNEVDNQLSNTLKKTQQEVHEALCDSFDTPRAVNALADLVTATNTYMKLSASEIKEPLLK